MLKNKRIERIDMIKEYEMDCVHQKIENEEKNKAYNEALYKNFIYYMVEHNFTPQKAMKRATKMTLKEIGA